MGAAARTLEDLVAKGAVAWSRDAHARRSGSGRPDSDPSRTADDPAIETNEPSWGFAELAGRSVEVFGSGASARLTIAARLVAEAQQLGEPAAWIGVRSATFYPPDVADLGVDLGALAVVLIDPGEAVDARGEKTRLAQRMLRAGDHLLRAGAFGIVVLDFPEPFDIPTPMQVRLSNLAKGHDSTLLVLSPDRSVRGSVRSMRGSLASLRAIARHTRCFCDEEGSPQSSRDSTTGAKGRFSCSVRVLKDKRRGREWESAEVFDGPVGMC